MTRANRTHTVIGWQGVPLHVPEFGNPVGMPVVLIHGWSQSHLSWTRQFSGSLAQEVRLIAPDLRGHGMSGKPDAAEHYDHSAPWAEDIRAILHTLNLHKPLLVGWSMGGWVVQDYLRVHGDADIGGIALVGSSAATGRHTPSEALARRNNDLAVRADGMYQTDLAANLAATIAFVQACFATPLDAEDLATMTGFNMLCPPHIRNAARSRHEDYRPDLAKTKVPALVQWGNHERMAVYPMPEKTAAVLTNSRSICYPKSGHAPFWEEAEAFNADLADFARTCSEKERVA